MVRHGERGPIHAPGVFSHPAFTFPDAGGGRRVDLVMVGRMEEEGDGRPPLPPPSLVSRDEGFGLVLLIDGERRRITSIVLWTLEPAAEGASLMLCPHFVGLKGADAFRMLFNSEPLLPGDEARVVGAVLSHGELLERLDRCSLQRARSALGGRYASGLRRDGGCVFAACTCSACPLPGEEEDDAACGRGRWEFHLMQFDIHYEGWAADR